MKRELLDLLLAERAAKQAVVLVTELATGRQELIRPQQPDVASSLLGLERLGLGNTAGKTLQNKWECRKQRTDYQSSRGLLCRGSLSCG